jgi:methionine aminopeptidase
MSLELFKKAKKHSNEILKDILKQDLFISRATLLKSSNAILQKFIEYNTFYTLGYPVCISINNETEFFCDYNDTTIIKATDLVKIEFCLSFMYKKTNYYYTFGKTINDKLTDKIYNDLSNELNKNNLIQMDEEIEYTITNDEIQLRIIDIYNNRNVYPTINNTSFCQMNGILKDYDSKYIKLNYKREKYQEKDNYCFDLENGDIYSLNLFFTKNDTVSEPKIKSTQLYSLSNEFIPLRLKMQKQTQMDLYKKYNNNIFNTTDIPSHIKSYGINSLLDTGLLYDYPCCNSSENVYMIKTVLVVENDKIYII